MLKPEKDYQTHGITYPRNQTNNHRCIDMTSFVTLTDMWHEHQYLKIGECIKHEQWPVERVIQFCGYFSKHVGVASLQQLYKFI